MSTRRNLTDALNKLQDVNEDEDMLVSGLEHTFYVNLEAAICVLEDRIRNLGGPIEGLPSPAPRPQARLTAPWMADSRPLLAEIEKLAKERDAMRDALEDAPIALLGEPLPDFLERYKEWYREVRKAALTPNPTKEADHG